MVVEYKAKVIWLVKEITQIYKKKLDNFNTVWKFQDFSIIQILREINFGALQKAQKSIKIKI